MATRLATRLDACRFTRWQTKLILFLAYILLIQFALLFFSVQGAGVLVAFSLSINRSLSIWSLLLVFM